MTTITYDLITIGDIKLDVFISLDDCKEKCSIVKKQLCLGFGEKIIGNVLDQQIAGSAPNVAVALARMKKKTAVVSNMGDDSTYEMTLPFLRKENVATQLIRSFKHTNSAYSAVLSLQGEKTILASYIAKPYKRPNTRSKWLYISEMGSGYEDLFNSIATYVKGDHTLLAFNPGNGQIQEGAKALYNLISATHVLFVNVEEGQLIVQNKRLKVKALAQELFNLGPTEVIITDGKNGSYGFDGTQLYYCPLFPAEKAVESTGAGDSFAAGYIGARMQGLPMQEGLRWGSVNAAEVIQHIGPTKGLLSDTQIKTRLRKQPTFETKILS
ncbi:carbohydrate kinase family protein [Candidatus Uhrbacteria bacterium]|nr:carbohydrate kinase family protein [Candidatus Uhrbacteria bacterium]